MPQRERESSVGAFIMTTIEDIAERLDRLELRTPKHDGLYTVKELSHLLGVSERTVWNLDEQGRLPGRTKLGRLVRWRVRSINAWAEGENLQKRQRMK